MANTIQSAYMDLQIPVPTVDPGPEWAIDLNACLTLIDSHNHSTGQGVKISPNGLNINSDLTLNSNNLLAIKSSRFTPNLSPLSSGLDIGCVYVSGADLYYNDTAGNEVRITNSGVINISGQVGFVGLPFGTASAAYISSTGTFQFQQATNTAANLDVASIAIRYPGSYPSPVGDFIQLQAPDTLVGGFTLTLPVPPVANGIMTMDIDGIMGVETPDQVAASFTSTGANAIAASMNSTGANSIASSMNSTGAGTIASTMGSSGANTIAQNRTRGVGTSVGLGGVAITAAANIQNTTSTFADVPSPISIVTSGRPVCISVIAAGIAGNGSMFFMVGGSIGELQVVRDSGPVIGASTFGTNTGGSGGPATCVLSWIDTVGAGTHVYDLQMRAAAGGTAFAQNIAMMVYEL